MSKRKVAILTLYYRNYNYGGLLQAYALQRSISSLNYDARQISYKLQSGYDGWNPQKAKVEETLANIYHYVKYNAWFKEYKLRNQKFIEFADKIPHTEVVTAQSISTLSDEYDCFICGSDQIWNPIGWQPTLFFNFLPKGKKRISYAASIARDQLTEKQFQFMKSYLEHFSAISVREKNAADMLNERFRDLNVRTMPDPVFLLDKEEWRQIISQRKKKKSFIFAYFLGNNEENREEAIRYARANHLDIEFASYLDFDNYLWDNSYKELLTPVLGVEDFLQFIRDAKVVLTDSFHAAAFSSILGTPFYALPRFKTTDGNSMNSRIQSLVDELQIQSRYCQSLDSDYSWNDVEKSNISVNLKRMKNLGLKFLETTL